MISCLMVAFQNCHPSWFDSPYLAAWDKTISTKIMWANGDLCYKQLLEAEDMPSINDFWSEVSHKDFYFFSVQRTSLI